MKKLLLLAALMFAVSGCATNTKETTVTQEPAQTTSEPAAAEALAVACPVACRLMTCPPPTGPNKKCCPLAPYTQTCP